MKLAEKKEHCQSSSPNSRAFVKEPDQQLNVLRLMLVTHARVYAGLPDPARLSVNPVKQVAGAEVELGIGSNDSGGKYLRLSC